MAELTAKTEKKINWKRRAWRRWPWAMWVDGDGRYATLAHCRVLTVELHEQRKDAEKALKHISETGCGGDCHQEHELVDLGQWPRRARVSFDAIC